MNQPIIHEIDSRDLLNMLRRAFLFGYNEATIGYLYPNSFLTRDTILSGLIQAWKAQGYETCNDDLGSLEE